MQIGARLPAVPSFIWLSRHLLIVLIAPIVYLMPSPWIFLMQVALPGSFEYCAGVPVRMPSRTSAVALCCDSMQVPMTLSSVRPE